MKIQKELEPRSCAYCGDPAEGNYAIHRDGFGIGPEVDLCDDCGSHETPTCEEIWRKIHRRRVSADLVGLQGPVQLSEALARRDIDYFSKRLVEASGRDDVKAVVFKEKGSAFIKLVDAEGTTLVPDEADQDGPWIPWVSKEAKGGT